MTDLDVEELPPEIVEQIRVARDEGHRAAGEKLPDPPQPQPRWRSWAFVALGLLVVAAVILLGIVAVGAKNAAKDAQRSQRAADGHVAALASQVRGLGGVPVATPTAGAPGAQGSTGPGPSDTQVQSAVAAYCAVRSGCAGTPSRTDVAAAVVAYCGNGRCRGPAGSSGAPGTAGRAGTGAAGSNGQNGADGATPTTADVAAAVVAYCAARDNCTGPAGPKGDTGATGATGAAGSPGRGITSVDCTGLGITRLRVTYDDGTTQDVPCDLAAPTDTPSASETP